MLILVKIGLKCSLRDLIFSGGHTLQTPLQMAGFDHTIGPMVPPPPPQMYETLHVHTCITGVLL